MIRALGGSVGVILAALLACGPAHAETAVELLEQTNQKVLEASRLLNEAERLIQRTPSRERFQEAARLYASAGQIFEHAAAVYRSLGPSFASKADVDNCNYLMQRCLKRLQELRAEMARA